jgi:lipoyl-dependent peroxiredoxin
MTTFAERAKARRAANAVMIRKAQVIWSVLASGGSGALSADAGALTEAPNSLTTRLGSREGGSPEELLAAAHAGCFTSALAFSLRAAGYAPTELSTEATVTREPDGAGYRISGSALTLRAKVPNLTRETFEALAWHAVNNCPISKVLRARIRLDAKLL